MVLHQCSEAGCEHEATALCRDCNEPRCHDHHLRPSLRERFAADTLTEDVVCYPLCEPTKQSQKWRQALTSIDNNFVYHAPKGDQPERYEQLRAKGKELARLMVELVPYSREQSLALTNLETAVMWANAGIARNE